MPTNKQKDAALIRRVMKAAGDVSQSIVAERLGKTQSAVSWCVTGRSELSPLERVELRRWLAELEAEKHIGESFSRLGLDHEVPDQPLAYFEHLKGCAACLVEAYHSRHTVTRR